MNEHLIVRQMVFDWPVHGTRERHDTYWFRYDCSQDCGFEFPLFCEVGEPYQQAFRAIVKRRRLHLHEIEIDVQPYVVTVHYRPQDRCKECENCRLVKAAAALLTPNPPFEHADDRTVECWNKTVFDNPCKSWSLVEGLYDLNTQPK